MVLIYPRKAILSSIFFKLFLYRKYNEFCRSNFPSPEAVPVGNNAVAMINTMPV